MTVITMGPPKATDVLRDCLYAVGRIGLILLTDRRAAASDTLATSYILAQAVKTVGPLRLRLLRTPGHRRRHGPGRAAVRRESWVSRRLRIWKTFVDVADGVRSGFGGTSAHGWEIVEAKLPVLSHRDWRRPTTPRPPAARRVMRIKRGTHRRPNWPRRSAQGDARRLRRTSN